MSGPFYARSASDKREDWPFWMVCRDGLNVGWRDRFGPKFAPREVCIAEAARLNAALPTPEAQPTQADPGDSPNTPESREERS